MGQKTLRRVLNTVGAFVLSKILAKLLLVNIGGAILLATTGFLFPSSYHCCQCLNCLLYTGCTCVNEQRSVG